MKNLKLTDFEAAMLSKKDMRQIVGGSSDATCGCSCYYANQGGSDTVDNGIANAETGASSPKGNNRIFHKAVDVVGDATAPAAN